MATAKDIEFVPMRSIEKKSTQREAGCTDWIATEKVHGSSFQFYTCDGQNIHMGSRNRCLDGGFTFQKCDLVEFLNRHECYVKRIFHAIQSEERWEPYRIGQRRFYFGEGNDAETDENGVNKASNYPHNVSHIGNDGAYAREKHPACEIGVTTDEGGQDQKRKYETKKTTNAKEGVKGDDQAIISNAKDNSATTSLSKTKGESKAADKLQLRIYGELFGGGGVHNDMELAIQKQIIYSDEFRFYVFGITINRYWISITELGDLCKDAGFLYYAAPICEPRSTLRELEEHLTSSGLMQSRSRLTEREDDNKTKIEGVVMYPLCRPGFQRGAVKLLSEAFNDVKPKGRKADSSLNYMTKARYSSVISKLDLQEIQDADLVTSLFIADIEAESKEALSNNTRKRCFKAVRKWLIKDGHIEEDRNFCEERQAVM